MNKNNETNNKNKECAKTKPKAYRNNNNNDDNPITTESIKKHITGLLPLTQHGHNGTVRLGSEGRVFCYDLTLVLARGS